MVTAKIRNESDSDWVEKSSGVCGLSGVGEQVGYQSPVTYFELVEGNKKQKQGRYYSGGSGSEPNCASDPNVEYCEGQNLLKCGGNVTNCIDPVDVYPYYCTDPPGTSWNCHCVAYLYYYEWECV